MHEPEPNINLGHESTSEDGEEQNEQPAQEKQPFKEIMPHDKVTSSSNLHDHT